MNSAEVKALFGQEKIVPILRTEDTSPLLKIAEAVSNAGGKILEFTMTIPGILDFLPKIKSEFPNLTLGMGTVLKPEDAETAIENGADFIVSHIMNVRIVQAVKSRDKLLALAGFTPTEIHNARMAGSDIVKLFPATAVTPDYLKSLKGPMPDTDILPTGGVDLITALRYLQAGAFCVGIGGTVFKKKWIDNGHFHEIQSALQNVYHRVKQMS